MLLFVPTFALKFLFSNSDYESVFPHTSGMLLIVLQMMIVQMIRFQLRKYCFLKKSFFISIFRDNFGFSV